jgi:hypothetical protein
VQRAPIVRSSRSPGENQECQQNKGPITGGGGGRLLTSSHIASNRTFARNLTSGWFALALQVAVAFLLTPFIIAKLGLATYGIWSLAIGVIRYLGLIDLGIRGSVGRYINHYLARNELVALDEVVSTSLAVLNNLLGLVALGAAASTDTYGTHQ